MRSNVVLFVVISGWVLLFANAEPEYYYPVHAVPVASLPIRHCLKKTCEQIVTGRHLSYANILRIIHHREYLNVIYINKHSSTSASLTSTPNDSNTRKRKKRQVSSPASLPNVTGNLQNLSPPLIVGIPLVILSAMFIASLRRKQEKEAAKEVPPEIIVETPPLPFTPLTPPHLPSPGQPVCTYLESNFVYDSFYIVPKIFLSEIYFC